MLLDRQFSMAMQSLIGTQLRIKIGTSPLSTGWPTWILPWPKHAKLKCWHADPANCVSAMALAARDVAAECVHASAEHVCQEELEVLTEADSRPGADMWQE